MATTIYRDIYVTSKGIPPKIPYVQGTNLIGITFNMQDFTIPSGATAAVYVKKISGAEVYNTATVSTASNTVSFTPTTQMVAEVGEQPMQIQIVSGSAVLVSFPIVLDVQENYIDGTAVESTDEFTVLTGLVTKATTAISSANSAATKANTAASSANTATSKANTAASSADTAASSANTAAAIATKSANMADNATTAALNATDAAEAAASKAEAAAGDFSNLTEKTTPATTDEYIFSDSGTLKKIKLTNLGNYLLETFTQSTFATTAKNILGAINELQTSLATAWSTINFHTEQLTYGTGLVHETKSGSITVSNGTGNATVSLTKSGYKALMVGELYTGSTWYTCVSTDFNASSQTARFFIRNVFDTSASGTVNISFVVLYIKTA